MASGGDRKEQPTAKHRKQARDEGRFAYSQELTASVTLAATLTVLFYTIGSGAGFRALLESLLSIGSKGELSNDALIAMMRRSGMFFFGAAGPILAAAFVAALAGCVLQGLPHPSAQAATLKWDHLNPVHGLSKLKGKFSWMEWTKILLFLTITGAIVWSALSSAWGQLVTLAARDIPSSTEFVRSTTRHVVASIAAAAVVIGVADYFLQRWRFEKGLRQTKAEVKEDMKSTEGNPLVRGKIRSIQREQARRRMMSRLKDANVIVTNPTHYAVALEYKPDSMRAPRVVAKGRGWLAQRIKALGRTYDIPTVENVPLARALYQSVDLEQEIPAQLYKAVAEVLAYVFKIRKGMQ